MMRTTAGPLSVAMLLLALPAAAHGGAKASGPLIKNAGFEAGLHDWELHVYGAKPAVALDKEIAHAGRQALRIAATAPSDTAPGAGGAAQAGPALPLPRLGPHQRPRSARRADLGYLPDPASGWPGRHRERPQSPRRHRLDRGCHRVRGPARRQGADRAVLRRLRQGHRHRVVRRPPPGAGGPRQGAGEDHARAVWSPRRSTRSSTANSSNTCATWCRACGRRSSTTAASRGSARTSSLT